MTDQDIFEARKQITLKMLTCSKSEEAGLRRQLRALPPLRLIEVKTYKILCHRFENGYHSVHLVGETSRISFVSIPIRIGGY